MYLVTEGEMHKTDRCQYNNCFVFFFPRLEYFYAFRLK